MSSFAPPPTPPTAPLDEFEYEAQSLSGQTLHGTLEAASMMAAQAQLQSLNLRVMSLSPADRAHKVRRTPLGSDDFLLFNQQLAHLTQAGLPVERGLRLIAADLKSGRLAAAANAVAYDLEKGISLKDAFARQSSQFPSLYAKLVDAGVQAGNLPGMLFNLGRHLELTGRLRRTLWRTLAYPIAVLAALCGILLFISLRVLPAMSDIYRDFRTSLPGMTEALIWIGPKIPYAVITVLTLMAILIMVVMVLRVTGQDGEIMDRLVFPLPLIGPLVRRSILARWCDALRVGVDAGLDLPRAMELAAEAVGSPRLILESNALASALSSGAPAMSFEGRLLPSAVPAAIEFGSHAGDLSATLATLSRMYEQQADQRLRALPALLTPILLGIIAVVIGTTIVAMFLPLIKLIQSVSGGM